MSNKICPKCNSEFKYPSSLKVHFRKSFHCLLNEEEIYNFFNKKPFNDKQCDKCNKIFCQKSVMLRHKRETKCCSTKLLSNKDNFANQNVDIINILNKIPTHLAKNLLELIVNKNSDFKPKLEIKLIKKKIIEIHPKKCITIVLGPN